MTTRPSLLTPVFGRILQPMLGAWRGERQRRYVGVYERFYRRSPEELQEQQIHDLRRILRHAQQSCPFYARRFADAGFDPSRVTAIEDLRGIPTLSRADVVQHHDDMLSTRFEKDELVTRTTGGTSTGRPVVFFQDREAIARKNAIEVVLRRTMGWEPGVRAAWVWAAPQDKATLPTTPWSRLKRLVTDGIARECILDARVLDDAICDRFLAELNEFDPHALQGYPVATDIVARRALETGVQIEIPVVILTAEHVADDQRARIHEAFGSNVLSFYGSRENGWIAFDHPETQEMLVNTAGVVLETNPETHELYVTDLLNHGFPLIRYEIGDRVTLSDRASRSGDPRPVLEMVHGRVADVVRLPSGRKLPGMLVDMRGLIRDANSLLFVQLVQNEIDTIDVYYVPSPSFEQAALDDYLRIVHKKFCGEMTFRTHAVDRIEPEPNGKVRTFICNLPPEDESRS